MCILRCEPSVHLKLASPWAKYPWHSGSRVCTDPTLSDLCLACPVREPLFFACCSQKRVAAMEARLFVYACVCVCVCLLTKIIIPSLSLKKEKTRSQPNLLTPRSARIRIIVVRSISALHVFALVLAGSARENEPHMIMVPYLGISGKSNDVCLKIKFRCA